MCAACHCPFLIAIKSFFTLLHGVYFMYVTCNQLYDRPNRPETLEVEPEEEVDTDEKGSYIWQSELENAIKETRNKKATGDDDMP